MTVAGRELREKDVGYAEGCFGMLFGVLCVRNGWIECVEEWDGPAISRFRPDRGGSESPPNKTLGLCA